MEVNRENFKTVLSELEDVLNSATFLAVDCEFTGLQKGERISPLDNAKERYEKLHSGAVDFLIVQLGLAAFQYDKASNKYSYRAYNFYVFPQTVSIARAPDPKFLCQASSLVFLASQGFDFNKLFRYGIPYLTLAEEEAMKLNLEERQQYRDFLQTPNGSSSTGPPIPPEQKSFMDSVYLKVKIFLEGNEESLTLDQCTPFQRKLIYTHLKNKYPSVYVFTKEIGRQRAMVVKRVNEEEQERMREDRKKEERIAIDDAVGFSKVLHLIQKSGKVVVGHNMLLDICHIIHQFYAQLPADYDEFKDLASTVFPKLIDTKVMASTQPFKDFVPNSALRDLLKTVMEPPFKLPVAETFSGFPGYDIEKDLSHEAGYDAFMTGLCFIGLSDYMGSLGKLSGERVLPDSPLIEPFINKIFMMRVFDIPYMNLGGPDIEPNRDHVFVVSFPKEWKTADIIQLFSVYGPVAVSWIDSTSAYVSLHRKENSVLVLRELSAPTCCTITTYALYKASVAKTRLPSTPAASLPLVTPKRPAEAAPDSPATKKIRTEESAPKTKKSTKTKTEFEVPDSWE